MNKKEKIIEIDENKINRLEIISDTGRELVLKECKIKIEIQDNGKTLKVFVK